MNKLPESSDVVIVGGGIIGCSTAYHLAKLNVETVLLERNKLTSGTTFHAAGLVGQLRSSANISRLIGNSIELYNRLESETGLATGWKSNGGLRLACNAERWSEVKRQTSMAHSFGLEMHLLTPSEAQNLWPPMNVDDVVGAAFMPSDGQANPSDITQALSRGARKSGALIVEDANVTGLRMENGEILGVESSVGFIKCSKVVACCGQWTRKFAGMAGVNVPLASFQHQYMITEAIAGVEPNLPTLRDPDRLTYYKEEVGGLVMGGYEQNPIPWSVDSVPENFHFSLLDSNMEQFEQLMELALGRVPSLSDAGIKEMINGPESFTPDGNFILGEAPELKNFFVGAGFNAFGIAAGGGAGMALAEWVKSGESPYDLWPVDIKRFGQPHHDDNWIHNRTSEAYGKHYTMAWPSEDHKSARPYRKSPLYGILKSNGAVFGEKLGWERPNWFSDESVGEKSRDIYSYERPNWFDAVGREHRTARESAVVFDQTSFAKFTLKGRDAENVLSWIAANNVSKETGSIIYTQMLNDKGGIECDLTCTRTAEDEYYIVTGTGFAAHDYNWISRNIPKGANVQLSDVTSDYSVLTLMGPNSRKILQETTNQDVSDTAFPFATFRRIEIAGCTVHALRITYVGELGWELHVSVENAESVYRKLFDAGRNRGLCDAGYRAIESLRLEKGYRAWGADIGPDHTPLEAGLGWAVKLKANTNFKGRQAVENQKTSGILKRLALFTTDSKATLWGREPVFRNGNRVGWLTSAGFGHTLGKPVGMGYIHNEAGIDNDFIANGSYELEVLTERIPCSVQLEPLYDPQMEKIKS